MVLFQLASAYSWTFPSVAHFPLLSLPGRRKMEILKYFQNLHVTGTLMPCAGQDEGKEMWHEMWLSG